MDKVPYVFDFHLTLTKQTPFLWFSYKDPDTEISIKTNFIGGYNVPNFLAAITIARYFKIPIKKALQALEAYHPGNNRSQLKETDKNILILDAYNSNPSSLTEAILNFISLEHPNKHLILGDMKELGKFSKQEHQKIADLFIGKKNLHPIFVGLEFAQVKLSENMRCFESIDSAIKHLKEVQIHDALILLKGSRSMKLEELIPHL